MKNKFLWKEGDVVVVPDVPKEESLGVFTTFGRSKYHEVGVKLVVKKYSHKSSIEENIYKCVDKKYNYTWWYRESDLLKSNNGGMHRFQPSLL